jgi:hypothetical protein
MKPAPGRYRLSRQGRPSMDVEVTDTTLVTTLDTFDYLPAFDRFRAQELSCVIQCLGTGNGRAFVGVTPGFEVAFTCEPIP